MQLPERGVEEQLRWNPRVGAGEDDGRRVGPVVGGAVGKGLWVGAAALELALLEEEGGGEMKSFFVSRGGGGGALS